MKYLLITLLTFTFALSASAQSSLLGQLLVIELSPRFPKPNELVQVSAQSSILDLSERIITWSVDEKTVSSGLGETAVEVRAPQSGKALDVRASVEGEVSDVSVSLTSASVDVLWEADSYAPHMYRGRHLPSAGATITLVAIPHILNSSGSEIPSDQITYTWKQNDRVLGSVSGKGKTSLTVPVSTFSNSDTFSVVALSPDKLSGAEGKTTIESVEPTVRLYQDHPLFGTMLYNALSATTFIPDREMSFSAVPYFVRAQGPRDPLFTYNWQVNQADVAPSDAKPDTITINAGNSSGRALIDLSVSHKANLLFDGRGTWAVTFGSTSLGGVGGSDPFLGQ